MLLGEACGTTTTILSSRGDQSFVLVELARARSGSGLTGEGEAGLDVFTASSDPAAP